MYPRDLKPAALSCLGDLTNYGGDDVVSSCDIRVLVRGHLPEAAH